MVKKFMYLAKEGARLFYEAKRTLQCDSRYHTIRKDSEQRPIYDFAVYKALDDLGHIFYEYRMTAFNTDGSIRSRRFSSSKRLKADNIFGQLMDISDCF